MSLTTEEIRGLSQNVVTDTALDKLLVLTWDDFSQYNTTNDFNKFLTRVVGIKQPEFPPHLRLPVAQRWARQVVAGEILAFRDDNLIAL
ncbi:hypothetical protein F53441_1270 [Fusarium austroafricanum]|uniref:Uncharacterized protein n=1 Tax=Fusarium austroafricanum TaxID=2364996 RepID=A0A8H4P598_9HYPO|nr:hypothetical protein F53441_1270 [Fusarium austroafricanum]